MNITVYTKPTCPDCITVKRMLASRGKEFTEVDLSNQEKLGDFLQKYPGIRKMPQVEVDGVLIADLMELRNL